MFETDQENKKLDFIFQLFSEELPIRYEIQNTSRSDTDFRETIIAEWKSGEKLVIKLSDNDFTFPGKIEAWKKCAAEYRRLGYYCPEILYSRNGDFPLVDYKGHKCIAYAEEYSRYPIIERTDNTKESVEFREKFMDAAFAMTARIAAERLSFTEYPSGYCLFDRFCPSDATDEVLEVAMDWKKYADTLPGGFREQTNRIWQRWMDNRRELEMIYHKLPTSVFQADLNSSNILLDESGDFVGVIDFNLCGRDVLLYYLFREVYWYADSESELQYILQILSKIRRYYGFSDIEKQSAPLLYRCIKPLWHPAVDRLTAAGSNSQAVKSCLDDTEYMQTRNIGFDQYMNAIE